MTQTIFKTPDAATGKTAKQERYEKKMAKYLANKARKEQKERKERNNKRFNYSEYLNAPIASVKYLDDNKFEIVVGAGGDYHYDDEYDNAAVDILNTTTFVVERVSGNSGHYGSQYR